MSITWQYEKVIVLRKESMWIDFFPSDATAKALEMKTFPIILLLCLLSHCGPHVISSTGHWFMLHVQQAILA